jgi:hypothetical protein
VALIKRRPCLPRSTSILELRGVCGYAGRAAAALLEKRKAAHTARTPINPQLIRAAAEIVCALLRIRSRAAVLMDLPGYLLSCSRPVRARASDLCTIKEAERWKKRPNKVPVRRSEILVWLLLLILMKTSAPSAAHLLLLLIFLSSSLWNNYKRHKIVQFTFSLTLLGKRNTATWCEQISDRALRIICFYWWWMVSSKLISHFYTWVSSDIGLFLLWKAFEVFAQTSLFWI